MANQSNIELTARFALSVFFVVIWLTTMFEDNTMCELSYRQMVWFSLLASLGSWFLFANDLHKKETNRASSTQIGIVIVSFAMRLYHTYGIASCNTLAYKMFMLAHIIDCCMMGLFLWYLVFGIFMLCCGTKQTKKQ